MLPNRSMPRCTVIPELAYADVSEAAAWLCDAFGFTLRLGIGNHRAQINIGDGAMVATERHGDDGSEQRHSVMVRVDDVDRHHDLAKQHGARILREPVSYPYGERQYTVQDIGGHVWTFSQSIADINPTDWGGTPGQL